MVQFLSRIAAVKKEDRQTQSKNASRSLSKIISWIQCTSLNFFFFFPFRVWLGVASYLSTHRLRCQLFPSRRFPLSRFASLFRSAIRFRSGCIGQKDGAKELPCCCNAREKFIHSNRLDLKKNRILKYPKAQSSRKNAPSAWTVWKQHQKERVKNNYHSPPPSPRIRTIALSL